MDRSPSAHSPDVRESRPSFRKPVNEASRRNYRRHSPSSSRSRSPSPGGWKRDRSPSVISQDDGGSKKGRNLEPDSEKDARSRRGADASARGYGNHSRDRHTRADDYNHSYNRRHLGYHDRSYHNSGHARGDYTRYDDGRYPRRSPERSVRERITEENGYRRKENRGSEKDRDRDDRSLLAKSADRDRNRDDEWDARDRIKGKERDSRHGQERFMGKGRDDDGSDVEFDRSRQGRRIDSLRDVVDGDRDTDKLDSKERHKFRQDTERAKEKESRQKERDDGREVENEKVEADRRRSRDKGHKVHDERRTKPTSVPDSRKDCSSDEPESTGDHLRVRHHGQDSSKKGHRDKKHSGDDDRSKFSSAEPTTRGAEATSEHSSELKRLDDKHSKGSKWGPEAENAEATATSSDPVAAKMAAMKAAALVNINLGGIKSVDEKKKMLWGSKDQQKPAAASGANRWETVRFADRDRQDKFQKLMGVKGDAEDGKESVEALFTSEKQEELQQDLEKQFTAGLRRRDGRTVGLGL